jgi:hypothetical protein
MDLLPEEISIISRWLGMTSSQAPHFGPLPGLSNAVAETSRGRRPSHSFARTRRRISNGFIGGPECEMPGGPAPICVTNEVRWKGVV